MAGAAHTLRSNFAFAFNVIELCARMILEHKVASYALATMFAVLATAWMTSSPRRSDLSIAVVPAPRALIIPVDGVVAAQLVDSWGAPRGSDRVHQGIDIMAPEGTPVRAAMAGTIAKLFFSKRGGITVYEVDPTGRFVFYYAHLKAYAPGLREGAPVSQGQQIGLVGTSGNATTPHLHFEIQNAGAPRQWWRGAAFDPYLPLKAGAIGAPPVRH